MTGRKKKNAGRRHHFESMLKTGYIKVPWLGGFFPGKSGIATLMDAVMIVASPWESVEAVRMLRQTEFKLPLILSRAVEAACSLKPGKVAGILKSFESAESLTFCHPWL